MIFVTTGTCEPFDRLLRNVDALGLEEDLVVQHGVSAVRPARALCIEFLPFDDLVEYVKAARVVITHAGVGSILVSLANGKHPIVVPRLREHGDAVDDHQLPLAERLAGAGLVSVAYDERTLRETLAALPPSSAASPRADRALVSDLGSYLRLHARRAVAA